VIPTTDPLIPPAWQAVDRLLDEIVPNDSQPSSRQLLDDAITGLVIDTMRRAVRRQGKVIAAALAGDLTSWETDGPQWPGEWIVDAEDALQDE
jgi:hypothetical protein